MFRNKIENKQMIKARIPHRTRFIVVTTEMERNIRERLIFVPAYDTSENDARSKQINISLGNLVRGYFDSKS